MSGRVAGKVAIVTGASRGVGKADAELLAAEGARVIMTDVNEEAGRAVAAQIGDAATFIKQDVSSESDWQSLVGTVEKDFGQLDILVNNAAILEFGDVISASYESWQRIFRINADSVFLGIKSALPLLEKSGGGSIINMSSSSALMGMPAFAAYGSAKAAVRGLTQSVAVYCNKAAKGVRCNSVHPDGIITPMTVEMAEKAAGGAQLSEPGRSAPFVCKPEEVAKLVLFLASDDSRHINGAAMTIDNGSTITPPYV
ncbi:MAG: SDR family oxidoreductase [Halioglobus sp.]|nr:SDR family oxidoreductase [Halioglobus sp.]